MKKIMSLVVLLLLVASLTACGGSAKSDGTMKLKLAENQPEDYPTTQGDKAFAKYVEEKTNGNIQIKVYAGGQLGDEKSVLEQVQLGTIDLARINGTKLTEFSDDIGVLTMPYLFRSEEHKWKVLNGEIGQKLLESLKSANMVGLTYFDSGARSFYNSKRLIKSPDDLKGLKIRVQSSDIAVDTVNALGASATPMSFGEVYSALQTGVIAGAENNLPSYYTTHHYEVAKYYTFDKHSRVPEVLLSSKKLWEKLSKEEKKIFKEAAKKAQKVERKAWEKLIEKSKKKLKKANVKFYEIKNVEPWREAVQPVYDKYGDKYQKWIKKIENVK